MLRASEAAASWVVLSLALAACTTRGGSSAADAGSGSGGTTGTTDAGSDRGTGNGGSGSGGSRGAGGANGDAGGAGAGAADAGADAAGCAPTPITYDQTILCDQPVAFWAMSHSSTTEADLTGNGHAGSYRGAAPGAAALPNGDPAAAFNGSNGYLTIPSAAVFSIPTAGFMTWEAWIRPDTLQFPASTGGYVDWMGKCADYAPTCEWEARLYNTTNTQNRCNRLSAYAFNPGAGLGSGADWQPTCGLFQAGQWLHVVGEYTTRTQPTDCADAVSYPGAIDIWVNGVPWDHASHGQTGCMSQYQVVPSANNSPVNIGTMAGDAWFQGAIGKVAIYASRLGQAQITAHYRAMTGRQPTGSCAATCSF